MNRRDMIRRTLLSTLGGASLYSQFGNLRLLQAAALDQSIVPSGSEDYKALVCVFLNGGNDNVNTVIPRDSSGYAAYLDARPGLALPLTNLAETHLNPLTAQSNGREYALHPSALPLRDLFESGRCAVVANVGPLIEPVTRATFQNGSVQVPPQLFSHSDQQVFWQTSRPDSNEKIGWAGRMADLLQASNPNLQLSMSISLRGHNFLQTGVSVQPYSMGTQGAEARTGYLGGGDNQARRTAIDALLNGPLDHPLERASADIQKRSRDNYALISSALAANAALVTPIPTLPPDLGLVANSAYGQLVGQLRMVGRMIQARSQLGQRRQIFYVSIGGYDFHDRLQDDHRDQLAALSYALQMFHDITVELGMQDKVTTFTASDFGRTSSANGDGSDHGWGGEHFVIGGAVRGRDIYGELPNLTRAGPDDAGWGQLIPKLAVDQYAATLARWFGVSESQIDSIFPALNASAPRFGPASGGYINTYRDLGFMAGA